MTGTRRHDGDADDADSDAVDDEGDWLSEPSPLEKSLARQDIKRMHKSLRKKGAENKEEAEEMKKALEGAGATVKLD